MKSLLLASTAIFVLSAGAFAADKESYQSNTSIEKSSDGNYNEHDTVTKTDPDGTVSSSTNNLSVEVDPKGNTDKRRTTETTSNPQGLGNKHVVTTSDTEKTQDGVVTTTHAKTVDGKNLEGTTDHYKSTSQVQRDIKGNFAERDITTKTEADGSAVSYEKDANVDVNANGDTDKITTTKQMTNPMGLSSGHTVNTSNTEKTKDGMVETSQAVTVDGKTVESKTEVTPQQ